MYLLSKFKFKKILIFILTFVMLVSVALATACADDSNSDPNDKPSSETETTITDYQAIKNGDFEFSTKDDTKFPYSSSISWTRSMDSDNTSSPSSKVSSGIIDTEDTAYDKLKEDERPSYLDGETTKYINPRTPYYYGLAEDLYDYEDKDKQANPNVKGSKILMIANKTEEAGVGTAQKFKSSSNIVVPADGYALISIWVKTVNLKSAYFSEGDFGAYISFTNKVGSNQFKDVHFENINTKGNWVKFETYVKGSDLASTTFTMTVGLGYGNGTFTKNYVEGFAYFDNAQVKTFTKSEFNALAKGEEVEIFDEDQENIFDLGDLSYNANPTEKAEYSKTEESKATYKKSLNFKEPIGTKVAVEGTNPNYPSYVDANGYDLTGAGKNKMATGLLNSINTTPIADEITTIKTDLDNDNPSLIYMDFETPSVATYYSNELSLKAKTYNYITFFAKAFGEYTSEKAKAEIYDVTADKYYTAFADIDTSDIEEGNYGGWDKYTIMVYNPTDTDTNYQIKLTFGCDTVVKVQDSYLLQKGYAIFADLNYVEFNKDDGEKIYNLISSGNVYKSSIYGKYTTFVEGDEETTTNDIYAVTTDIQGDYDIKTKPVTSIKEFSFVGEIPENCITGIINSKYVNNNNTKYGIDDSTAKPINGLDVFKTLTTDDNTYAQAVVIDNKTSLSTAYRSVKFDITANSFRKISLKVKATGSAVANVYLIDLEGNPISLSAINKTLKATVKADAPSIDGKWVEVCFYVATGNKDMSCRLEIWNGDKDSGSQGAIFFESVISTTIEESVFNMDKDNYIDDYSEIEGYEFETKKHTRPNAIVKETIDGEVVESTKTFNPQEIYAGNQLVAFANFETIHYDEVIDNTVVEDDDHDHDHDHEAEEDGYTVTTDAALQISTIAIAIVLLAVMIAVLVRTTFKNRVKKQGKIKEYYGRDVREKAMNKIASKKNEVKLADNEEEYDYEEAQAIDEEATEEVVEETIEEPAEAEEVVEETNESSESEKTEE